MGSHCTVCSHTAQAQAVLTLQLVLHAPVGATLSPALAQVTDMLQRCGGQVLAAAGTLQLLAWHLQHNGAQLVCCFQHCRWSRVRERPSYMPALY